MDRQFRIAPSILAADCARLGEEVRAVIAAGADLVHFDVMDNHYVPNLTLGPLVCAAVKPHSSVPIDVHLMVKPVDRIVPDFARAGAANISFHPEATEHVDRTIGLIHESGCTAGLVFNPATPLDWLMHVIDKLDLVLIMSVNPGFGGQSFIPHALEKIRAARKLVDAAMQRTGRVIRLEVDGGVKVDNIGAIAQAGADTIVAGSAIFDSPDYAETIAKLRAELAVLSACDTGRGAITGVADVNSSFVLRTVKEFRGLPLPRRRISTTAVRWSASCSSRRAMSRGAGSSTKSISPETRAASRVASLEICV